MSSTTEYAPPSHNPFDFPITPPTASSAASSSHHRSRSAQAYVAPPPVYTEKPSNFLSIPGQSSHTTSQPENKVKRSFSFSSLRQVFSRNRNKYDDPDWLRKPMRKATHDNALELLSQYDTVILVDDSGSMFGARWSEASHALAQLAKVAAEYDDDGLDIYFLNSREIGHSMKSETAVMDLFKRVEPSGGTPTGDRLDKLLREYLSKLEAAVIDSDGTPRNRETAQVIKRVNYIVITDGEATDSPKDVIVDAGKRLARLHNLCSAQLGVQFIQIGNSADATRYLKELDDDLASAHGIPDFVDTTPYGKLHPVTADGIIKCLLGGVNRRVDRLKN
ncbi:hypothetical protein MKEN_01349000 [Mycena kentingensis (nom. inval.)]|nr:hypothetical protein MKEN_01349000 [Mycena kentingensis (nom. inval.)]